MKKFILLFCALILAAGLSTAVFATDITSAKYLVKIQISNNSTSTQTNQPVIFSLSTNACMDAGMLNASATDVVMLKSPTGADVPFMPGLDANPWVFLVDSIGAGATDFYYDYMKDVTGGSIRWFPGSTGLVVPDGMTEPSSNFSLALTDIFIDTTVGASKYIFQHYAGSDDGLKMFVSENTTGTVVASVGGLSGHAESAILTGIATGEHDISMSLSGGVLTFTIDGTSATHFSSDAANAATGWTFCENDTVTYIKSISYSVGGAAVAFYEWEYDTTFHDGVGSNDGTASFRTTGSSDVTVISSTTEGLYTPTVPTTTAGGGWNMITTSITSPAGIYSDGGSGFPLGPQISAAAASAGDNPTYWIYLFAFGLAIAAFVFVYAKTHSSKLGRRGSLILSAIVGELVLVYFYIVGAVPGLALIPAGILLITLVFWRKSAAPVD